MASKLNGQQQQVVLLLLLLWRVIAFASLPAFWRVVVWQTCSVTQLRAERLAFPLQIDSTRHCFVELASMILAGHREVPPGGAARDLHLPPFEAPPLAPPTAPISSKQAANNICAGASLIPLAPVASKWHIEAADGYYQRESIVSLSLSGK